MKTGTAALLMRDPVAAGRRYLIAADQLYPTRAADEGDADRVEEPRAPPYADSAERKAARDDAKLFDRLGIPEPKGGGPREGLIEAATRAAGARTAAFEAAGGKVGASLLHEPVEWVPQWAAPACLLREPLFNWDRGPVSAAADDGDGERTDERTD